MLRPFSRSESAGVRLVSDGCCFLQICNAVGRDAKEHHRRAASPGCGDTFGNGTGSRRFAILSTRMTYCTALRNQLPETSEISEIGHFCSNLRFIF